MLTLYHGATSVCSQKVRVGLAEMGLDYEGVTLDLQKGDQFAEEYRRLNPDAVVPTLKDDGFIVVESSLILEYLDREYNEARLMPRGRETEARTRHWLLRCLAIHAAINTLTFSTARRDTIRATKSPEEIESLVSQMPDPVARLKRRNLLEDGLESVFVAQALMHLRRAFTDMDRALVDGAWVSGAEFGISDIALVAYVDRLERLGFEAMWRDEHPRVATWLAAMQARPSYAAGIGAYVTAEAAALMKSSGERHWPKLAAKWRESVAR